jgi:hypothetical protein
VFRQAMTDFFGAASATAAAASAVPATLPLIGTFRTWRDTRLTSAKGFRADIKSRCQREP